MNKQRNKKNSYLEDTNASAEYYDPGDDSELSGSAKNRGLFLGMTALQRFVIVVILFLMTCVLGTFCLVLSGKVWFPFF